MGRTTILVWRAVIALAVVIVVVGGVRVFRQGELRFDRIDPQQGTRIYQRDCAECHGADAEGKDRAPPLNPAGHAHHHADWELVMIIAEGRGGLGRMPAWKEKLSDQEIQAVVAYIKTLWTEDQRRFQQEINRARPAPP